ncbi:MAG: flavodoxin family protein [Promethearchaeota archaeon]
MKKVWIIHNSKYGNSEKLANDIAINLESKFSVKVRSIKNIRPEEIGKENPHILIFGVRILATMSDRKLRKFISKIGQYLNKQIEKVAVFYTHAAPWRESFAKGMKKTLNKLTFINEVFSEFLELRMATIKGPAEPGQEEKIKNFIEKLINFIEN